MPKTRYFSAGEIEKYGYCPLSWWLSRGEEDAEVKELEPLVSGIKKHEEVSEDLSFIKGKETVFLTPKTTGKVPDEYIKISVFKAHSQN